MVVLAVGASVPQVIAVVAPGELYRTLFAHSFFIVIILAWFTEVTLQVGEGGERGD